MESRRASHARTAPESYKFCALFIAVAGGSSSCLPRAPSRTHAPAHALAEMVLTRARAGGTTASIITWSSGDAVTSVVYNGIHMRSSSNHIKRNKNCGGRHSATTNPVVKLEDGNGVGLEEGGWGIPKRPTIMLNHPHTNGSCQDERGYVVLNVKAMGVVRVLGKGNVPMRV